MVMNEKNITRYVFIPKNVLIIDMNHIGNLAYFVHLKEMKTLLVFLINFVLKGCGESEDSLLSRAIFLSMYLFYEREGHHLS